MINKNHQCIICASEMEFFLTGRDFLYRTTKKTFKIYKCPKCGLEQIIPLPGFKEINKFYPKNYYSFSVKIKKNFFKQLREKIIGLSYNNNSQKDYLYYLATIAKYFFDGLPLHHIRNNNFLDVGCGDGYNLNLMQQYGWKCLGFEIGNRKKIKNIFYDKDISKVDFGKRKFDYIRIWHVLEHVNNPKKFISTVKRLLDVEGQITIGLPNTKSLYAKLFRKYWYNRDIPRHVFNYNYENLNILFKDNEFSIIKIKHLSAGGFLGSFQHLINYYFGTDIKLINNFLLFKR